jgi:hypothetical protein
MPLGSGAPWGGEPIDASPERGGTDSGDASSSRARGDGTNPPSSSEEPNARQRDGDAAVVVLAVDAKRWKDALRARGWLDRGRRATSFPADDGAGRPAAVAFPVGAEGACAMSKELADGDDDGVLALCRLRLPAAAPPGDQRASEKVASGSGAAAAAAVAAAPKPPPAMPIDAPVLWPPPRPPPPPSGGAVRRVRCPSTPAAFAEIIASMEPVVFTDVPMGTATEEWTVDALMKSAESERIVDVHVCPPRDRDGDGEGTTDDAEHEDVVVVDLAGHRAPGTRRNFQFRKMRFAELVERAAGVASSSPPVIAPGEKYYLRSVATTAPTKTAAHFPEAYPSLAASMRPGVVLPDGTGDGPIWPKGRYHSSVLRVSSPATALWTHYDTHDNLLAQVVGSKTVTLWPPHAEPFMYVEGSSSRVDVDAFGRDADAAAAAAARYPKFAAAAGSRRVARLGPGEALYIPALWFHHVYAHASRTSPLSVAVNVFWRCEGTHELHDAGDAYGNKDPPAARRAGDLAALAGDAIDALPEPHRTFYARRAVQRLAAQLGMELGV